MCFRRPIHGVVPQVLFTTVRSGISVATVLFACLLLVANHSAVAAPAATAEPATVKPESSSTPVTPNETKDAPATKPAEPTAAKFAQIDLDGHFQDSPDIPGLFGETQPTLSKLLRRLDRAGLDEQLTGVVLNFGNLSLDWSQLFEIQQAIDRLKKKGRRVVAWMESADNLNYLLATACDEIILPESGGILLVGLRAELSFYKKMLELLSIETEALRVGEFKSAGEPFTRNEMSPEFREEMTAVLNDRYEQMVQDLVDRRKLSRESAIYAIDNGPYTASRALSMKLIDRLAYESDLPKLLAAEKAPPVKLVKNYGKAKLDTDFSGMAGLIKLMNLLAGAENGQRKSNNPKVAIIYANGGIVSGRSVSDSLMGEVMGSTTMVKAIRQARDDSTVKAIVLRVNSPGGSALASDLIWHELETVDKPIVASMGSVAASGGYYISMGADRIIAEPGTITGSIGVIGMKMAFDGLYKKIGISTEVIQHGKNAGVLSTLNGLTEPERTTLQLMLKEIYSQFTGKAAKGRKMDVEKLERLARGRIYTGRQAKELGLIDQIGTLDDALAVAKELAGIKKEDRLERLVLPKASSPLESIFGPQDTDTQMTQPFELAKQPVWQLMPVEMKAVVRQAWWISLMKNEQAMFLLPYTLQIR